MFDSKYISSMTLEFKSKLEMMMKEQYNITRQCDYALGNILFIFITIKFNFYMYIKLLRTSGYAPKGL